MGDLSLIPVLDTADMEMGDRTHQFEVLVDEVLHVLFGLQTPHAPGVYMGDIEHGPDPVHTVHDLPDLLQSAELTLLSHGLDTEDDVLDSEVVEPVLAYGHPLDHVIQRCLGVFSVGSGVDDDEIGTEIMGRHSGIHHPIHAFFDGLRCFRIETDEIRSVAA